jgi:uncharacterized membrane-anchored protein YhcB (DUF1043 family)
MILTLAPTAMVNLPAIPTTSGPSLVAWLPALVMIVGVIVLGIVMMRLFHKREQHLHTLASQIASDLEEARALRLQLDEVHTRAANLLGTAQRLGARLDERVASLDVASLRMQAARTSLPRTTIAAASASSPASNPRTVPAPAQATPAADARAVALADAPRSVTRATVEAKPALDPLTRQVYALADAGRPALSIARDLNEQVGKVELILALRKQLA